MNSMIYNFSLLILLTLILIKLLKSDVKLRKFKLRIKNL